MKESLAMILTILFLIDLVMVMFAILPAWTMTVIVILMVTVLAATHS